MGLTSQRCVVNRLGKYLGTVTDSDLSRPKFLQLISLAFGSRRNVLNSLTFGLIYPVLFSPSTFAQVDRLEDELASEQEKLKGITEELEQTFAEMSGY